MSPQVIPLVGCLFTQMLDSSVGNTINEQSLIGSGVPSGNLLIPGNYLIPGRIFRFSAGGYYSTTNPPGTLQIKVKLGNTIVLDTGQKTPVGNCIAEFWSLNADIICQEAGVSGLIKGHGQFIRSSAHSIDVIDDLIYLTTPIAFDTTQQYLIDITAQWSTQSVSNTITSTNLTVLIIG